MQSVFSGESLVTDVIPKWVNWLAQDSSGCWWGYSAEPLRHDSGWYENEVGRCLLLGEALPVDWMNSLRRVTRN